MARLVSSSTALALITKHKSTSPSAITMKSQWKAVSIEGKLGAISRLEKGDRIVDMWHNVRFTHNSLHAVCDNADKIIEDVKLEPKLFM
jgi:tRNA1(Val) A37 N6-methylase TrmN6